MNHKTSFIERFKDRAKTHSPFCLGIDPSRDILKHWQLNDDLAGLNIFCDKISKLFAHGISIIKPQWAFFERFGPGGLEALQKLIETAHEHKLLVLADCKRGDISHTMLAYTQSIVGPSSAYKADAMTVLPYMGLEAMQASIDYANKTNSALFAVIRSSNPEASTLQNTTINNSDATVAESIAQLCNNLNKNYEHPILHAVIGATLGYNEVQSIIQKCPNSLYLTPGIGAQGASYEDLAQCFNQYESNLIPTSSRAVLKHGPDLKALASAIDEEKQASFRLINYASI